MKRILLLLLTLVASTNFPSPHLVIAQTASSNPEAHPGLVMVKIKPAIVQKLRDAFAVTRPIADPTFTHSDIHLAKLQDATTIENVLGITGLHGLQLRPYLPTHSIAFEEIRERSNPSLFQTAQSFTNNGGPSNELRKSEESLSRWFVLSYDNSLTPERAAQIVKKSALIEYAEPKYDRVPLYRPNDSLIDLQYSLPLMHAFEAWDVVRCDSTMLVADVDVGTDWTHKDLAPSIHLNYGEIGVDSNGLDKRANGVDDDGNGFIDDWHGWDFDGPDGSTPDNDPRTPQEHGTHTAGIMAAAGNNVQGIAGIAFGARILPLKVSNNSGQSLDFGFEGITYAADMHAKVVNCSWGGPTKSQAEQDVLDYASAKDLAVVAAAGNNGLYQDFYPASYNHVLSVSALQSAGDVDYYSNFSMHVGVAAPGTDVLSTVSSDNYTYLTGTSMASPNAAGAVALVRQRFPKLTAAQAMQQVRATSSPFVTDSKRQFLVGHGMVNLLDAVTDTNAHSARIEGYLIADDNGNGSFEPGESGGIIVSVRNFLKPVQNLNAKVEIIEGGNALQLRSSVVPFGSAQTLQVVENLRVGFMVTASDSLQPNTKVVMRLTFYDSTVGYTNDVDYLTFILNPAFLDLNKNNITATFSSKGSIGYNDVVANSQGNGFKWSTLPASILPISKSVLYQGGLMVGVDAGHVVDVVQNDRGADAAGDEDFVPTELIHYTTPDHTNALQELKCAYTDSSALSSSPVGVRVGQQSYEFGSGLSQNAVVVRYVLRKDPQATVATDQTSAVFFADWDIGLSGTMNNTYFDSANSTAVTYRMEPQYPYVGVKLISPLPAGAELQYHAIRNDGTQGDINTYDGFDKTEKWRSMTEFLASAGPADVSHTYGVKNIPLLSQDSIVMVYVIALAEDANKLTQTINQTAAAWNGTASVNSGSSHAATSTPSLTVYPNPFRDMVSISWESASESEAATVRLIDALGRVIVSKQVTGNNCELTQTGLSEGFYVVDILQGNTHFAKQVVAIR